MVEHVSPGASALPAVFRRVLRRRCPQCERGPLFRSYARLHPSCSECGLVYRREQGAQTGSMYLTAAVNQVFAALVIGCIWIFFDWSVVRSLVVGVPLVALFSVLFLPLSMALWVGVEYATDVGNREDWTQLR